MPDFVYLPVIDRLWSLYHPKPRPVPTSWWDLTDVEQGAARMETISALARQVDAGCAPVVAASGGAFEVLGVGGQAQVYLIDCKGIKYALKINIGLWSGGHKNEGNAETKAMAALADSPPFIHLAPNKNDPRLLVHVAEKFKDSVSGTGFAMELGYYTLQPKDLKPLLTDPAAAGKTFKHAPLVRLNMVKLWSVAVLEALVDMRGKSIAHLDIKESNMVFSKPEIFEKPKLLDFGMAVQDSGPNIYNLSGHTGTQGRHSRWRVGAGQFNKYNEDVWSAGVVILGWLALPLADTFDVWLQMDRDLRQYELVPRVYETRGILGEFDEKHVTLEVLSLEETKARYSKNFGPKIIQLHVDYAIAVYVWYNRFLDHSDPANDNIKRKNECVSSPYECVSPEFVSSEKMSVYPLSL